MTATVRQTKIAATVGPASNSRATLLSLIRAGVNVFRLNFSHGTHDDHAQVFQTIRELEQENDIFVCVLADLQGPKIRIGTISGGSRTVTSGEEIQFVSAVSQDPSDIHIPHPEIFETIKNDDLILIDDGRIRFRVTARGDGRFKAKALNDSTLRDRKGVNFPDTHLNVDAMTPKDHEDLRFALGLGVDWIALSFVQTADDVGKVKGEVAGRARIVAKIEKPLALKNIDSIIAATDAIMVARGDLGVECDWFAVPGIQTSLVAKCREAGKPVIVATQMMESMITEPIPTRAETSDVSNAVAQRADAVMLSAESAAGKYPVEAVQAMARIIEASETALRLGSLDQQFPMIEAKTDSGSIASAATLIASLRNACAILTYTETGATALRVSKSRCQVPILAVCPNESIARELNLGWGITPIVSNNLDAFSSSRDGQIPDSLASAPFIVSDRPVVVTSGSQHGKPGGTDSIKIAYLKT